MQRFDESIATFERAIELGWGVVPDGRCEIAHVLLLAGRHGEAGALWRELLAADPDGVWSLDPAGFAYRVDRYVVHVREDHRREPRPQWGSARSLGTRAGRATI